MEVGNCFLPEQPGNPTVPVCHVRGLRRFGTDELIFILSCLVALLFLHLPMEDLDSNVPVPTFLFKGRPSAFHAFLVGLTGASCGITCSMHLRERSPKASRIFRCFGRGAMAATVGIFLWVAAPSGFSCLASCVH